MEGEAIRIDKRGNEITKTISYKLQFMASSLSNLVTNLAEGIHRIKCKYGRDNKKCESWGITYKYYDCFLEYTHFKDDLME